MITQRRLIFLILRANHYRVLGPVIEEAVRRSSFRIECWHDDRGRGNAGSKSYQRPTATAEVSGYHVRTFVTDQELAEAVSSLGTDDELVCIQPASAVLHRATWLGCRARWNIAMCGLDTFYSWGEHLEREQSYGGYRLRFLLYSEYWREWGKEFLERFYSPWRDDFLTRLRESVVVGCPEMDDFAAIDRTASRAKYRIPPDRRLVVYLPYAYAGRRTDDGWEEMYCGAWADRFSEQGPINTLRARTKSWLKIIRYPRAFAYGIRRERERDVFRALRDFSHREGGLVAIKPRLKYRTDREVLQQADRFVYDPEVDNRPPKLKELVSIADLVVSTYSTSVLTAAFAGVWHVNVRTPEALFINDPERFWFLDDRKSFFDFPGLAGHVTPAEARGFFGRSRFEHFRVDPSVRLAYVRRFLGFDDARSSARMVEALESRSIVGEGAR